MLLDVESEPLITRAGTADIAAFSDFYDRYVALAHGLAHRLLLDHHCAEDVVQESFLAAWRGAGTFCASRGLEQSWFLRIVRHRCIDHLRAQSIRPRSAGPEAWGEEADGADVPHEAMRRLSGEQVRRCLLRLSAVQRQVIELAYCGGYTHKEIASRLGLPTGTVKGRMRLGLQNLRAFLVEADGHF